MNADAAARSGTTLCLRIEDIDQGRCRPEFEEAIIEDLAWLGISWATPVMRQSERFAAYEDAIRDLAERGLLYRCFKTRAELKALARAPHGVAPRGPMTAPLPASEEKQFLSDGKSFAWRLNTSRTAEALGTDHISWTELTDNGSAAKSALVRDLPDEVLGRKDFPASYHLASVIDDAAQGVTAVLRGEDLESAIPVHRVLQELLGLPTPVYKHHRLITDDAGNRLAKRDRAATLRSLRENGVTPAEIRQRLGLPPASFSSAHGAGTQ
ncbi:MAG: tRNA glutamyl-Q(34) synthetase GluQRS [Pseudomonadota bacterium]